MVTFGQLWQASKCAHCCILMKHYVDFVFNYQRSTCTVLMTFIYHIIPLIQWYTYRLVLKKFIS